MIYIIIFVLCICVQSEPLLSRGFLEKLRKEVDWKVVEYEDSVFKGFTLEEMKEGYKNTLREYNDEKYISDGNENVENNGELPMEFDGRKKWPSCIHPIMDQGKCNSCWAFSVTGPISDRFCIANKDVILSPQYLISCDRSNDGCRGGNLNNALSFMTHTGSVSDACFPYVSENNAVPACPVSCKKTEKPLSFVKYRCKSESKKYFERISQMKKEIMENGPVTTSFSLYRDFFAYKGGVYQHASMDFIGIHAAKVIGWGKAQASYWIIANSYGQKWGENGYVRFKMNDCSVNNKMYSCTPQL